MTTQTSVNTSTNSGFGIGEEQGRFPVLSPGTYPGRVFAFISLGEHEFKWNDEMIRNPRLAIVYKVYQEDRTLRPVSEIVNLSSNRKSTLCTRVAEMTGKSPFNVQFADLLNLPVLVSVENVTRNEKTFAKITSVIRPFAGVDCGEELADAFTFDISCKEDLINKLDAVKAVSEFFGTMIVRALDEKKKASQPEVSPEDAERVAEKLPW